MSDTHDAHDPHGTRDTQDPQGTQGTQDPQATHKTQDDGGGKADERLYRLQRRLATSRPPVTGPNTTPRRTWPSR